MRAGLCIPFLLFLARPAPAADSASGNYFADSVRPVLAKHCTTCHNPQDAKNKAPFLKASSADDVAASRGLWRKVALQLRNRTMPPAGPQPSEEDRFRIATWIETRLRETACEVGNFAGSVTVRRLNRREYDNTIRDLVGLEMNFAETFPMDGSGGEGFDNNGETLFLPPLLMERYLQAAQQVVDAAIITPPLEKSFDAADLLPEPRAGAGGARVLKPGAEVSALVPIYIPGDYTVTAAAKRPREKTELTLKVDGIGADTLAFSPPEDADRKTVSERTDIRLTRGLHSISLQLPGKSSQLAITSLRVQQGAIVERGFSPTDALTGPPPAKRAIHHRLLGRASGATRLRPREDAREILSRFLPRAFRRPIEPEEVDRFLALYDRSAERGDPFEERIKLALKGALVSPDFLFRMEKAPDDPGPHPISDHELAVRLSYFLWSTMPDEQLIRLADAGRLQDEQALAAQVERMLDDPKSRVFAETFIGQWLGTKDVGGRVAPTVNAIQHFYTPKVAADMREEAVLLFQYMLNENRSLLDLIDSDYTFVTGRLATFYRMKGADGLPQDGFRRVALTEGRRGGVLGLGGVLAMTSHYQQTSPVLRGVWVLETLLGTPVPTPPPDVPPLETEENKESGLTVRQMLEKHRADPACAACHDLIDPIGYGLEHFDYLGRWRNSEDDGRPIDARGVLPSGETFNGSAELRAVLLKRKHEFLRHITGKALGYALGRSLVDEDQCVVQRIVDELEQENYSARTLIREIVLSTPFRYSQRTSGGAVAQAQ